jgi:Raf kinase inhibitor-like YbhB/YbcL family protein
VSAGTQNGGVGHDLIDRVLREALMPGRTGTCLAWVLAAALTACGGGEDRAVEGTTLDIPASVAVSSPAFSDGAPIPREYTCHGAGTTPPLSWTGGPTGTASIAVVVVDPDAPHGTFVHWVLVDVPAAPGHLDAGAVPPGAHQARNSGGGTGWTPPCPPSGTHQYRFTVYTLSGSPDVADGAAPDQAIAAVQRVATAQGTLTGTVTNG